MSAAPESTFGLICTPSLTIHTAFHAVRLMEIAFDDKII
jgi:hypothetical protein